MLGTITCYYLEGLCICPCLEESLGCCLSRLLCVCPPRQVCVAQVGSEVEPGIQLLVGASELQCILESPQPHRRYLSGSTALEIIALVGGAEWVGRGARCLTVWLLLVWSGRARGYLWTRCLWSDDCWAYPLCLYCA